MKAEVDEIMHGKHFLKRGARLWSRGSTAKQPRVVIYGVEVETRKKEEIKGIGQD